ncbi:MAG: WD40 repeat domain-containing protein [Terriglobia bacterium]
MFRPNITLPQKLDCGLAGLDNHSTQTPMSPGDTPKHENVAPASRWLRTKPAGCRRYGILPGQSLMSRLVATPAKHGNNPCPRPFGGERGAQRRVRGSRPKFSGEIVLPYSLRPDREPQSKQRWGRREYVLGLIAAILALACTLAGGQLETAAGSPASYVWQSEARIEGHLALAYSPDGAFSGDSSVLAIAEKNRVVLMNLAKRQIGSIMHPKIPGIKDLEIQSASFVAPGRLFVLAIGLTHGKKRHAVAGTMEFAFQWDTSGDSLFGKADSVGASGGFSPPRYFSGIKYLGLYKNSAFQVWNPVTGRGGTIPVPELTHIPQLFTFSPDGHWLLLAQVQTNASPNPIVVSLRQRKFVGNLEGHHGAVLGMMFSRDSRYVATASEDGSVRLFSAPDWQLLQTFRGHTGPVHWAEFSPNDSSVVSANQDTTARIWSVKTGKLMQTLRESHEPLLTVAFSPNGQYLAATSSSHVYVWARGPLN